MKILRNYIAKRTQLLSYMAAAFVGFFFGVGSLTIALASLIIAIILDIISHVFSEKGRGDS